MRLPPSRLALVCLLVSSASALVAQTPAPSLPPPELTEQWWPVPPKVDAPAGGAPSDAVVLFDGTSLDAWIPLREGSPGWKLEQGLLTVVRGTGDIQTRAAFGDVQVHVEFRCPPDDAGRGQGLGNSGVLLMGLYEIQVLDNHTNKTYVNGQAAAVYKQHPPLVNACRPAGEWQAYDIVFTAPRFGPDGSLTRPGRVTILHNGVLVQHEAEIRGSTVYRGEPKYTAHAARLPLRLQNHGDAVSFRNIWVRNLAPRQP